MDMKVLILWIPIISLGYCAVEYINHGESTYNMVQEGSSVTISCYFDGDKPPGPSIWTLDDQPTAFDCHMDTPGKGIITPTADCSPDPGNGSANCSFMINKISLDRDQNNWMCQNFDLQETLHLPIAVIGEGNVKYRRANKSNEYLTVTADIGCSYPPGEVEWCLDDGIGVKCSNETDWFVDVFERNLFITQTTENCTNYKTPSVLKYQSLIEGKIVSAASNTKYHLYYRLNGIDYKTDGIEISPEGNCPKHILPTVTIAVEAINITLLIVSIIFTAVVHRRGPRTNASHFVVLLVMWMVDILLFVGSCVLCFNLFLCDGKINEAWIMTTWGLFGVIVVLIIVHVIQIILRKMKLWLFYESVLKSPTPQQQKQQQVSEIQHLNC